MLSSISTRRAVASNQRHLATSAWRVAGAQHHASTIALTNDLDEQALLEELLEESKPPMPQVAAHLHYLLATPFRYPPHAEGSRFRTRADPGVFYCAFHERTAFAEVGFHRWQFLKDSPDLSEITSRSHTLFRSEIGSEAVIDLRDQPFVKDRKAWTDRDSYSRCQLLAQAARKADVELIVYESVRDPERAACIALLSPKAFTIEEPTAQQSWLLTVTQTRVFWQSQNTAGKYQFDFTS